MKSIELHHLDRHCRTATDNTFPVRWPSSGLEKASDILASQIITGAEADDLAALFDRTFSLVLDTSLCGHMPNYGVRYFQHDILTLETTICFTCVNWIGFTPYGPERFSIANAGRDLFSRLNHFLPLSPGEVA